MSLSDLQTTPCRFQVKPSDGYACCQPSYRLDSRRDAVAVVVVARVENKMARSTSRSRPRRRRNSSSSRRRQGRRSSSCSSSSATARK